MNAASEVAVAATAISRNDRMAPSSALQTRDKRAIRFFESRDCEFPRDRGEVIEKLVKIVTADEIVYEILERHTRASKHGSAAKDSPIANDHLLIHN